ncbi:aromatic ring-hydroxylating dioxygenase subunit alpha [Vitiosangium sp. GDMCC 1.1324]|uniref:aromatic ring-hydroxylating oxygenase subunit alpha n=1 Tax=Vitiosangium sp. (strain GDMCC 1.1324) TaxID=2138576 RepID=UPI000D3BBEB7|nr:SRPBCC family protein [Vitiosangium sp. GDMCC 1.1324]PTL81116.1 Rieske (2Fe-2S) domain-containing protein [Vitiosangium sp. GDMCC 1.1324]
MDHATQVELIHRIQEHLRTGTTHMEAEESRIPVECYLRADRLEAERELLFQRRPLLVAHSSQLAEPGDYLTHDASGLPLLVCRTASGEPAAFLNVCRHRGTRLVEEEHGRRKHAFVCPYHAWTYDTEGRLRSVPHEEGFPSRPSESVGLARVSVAERFGFLWAQGRKDSRFAADAFLAPIATELASYGLEKHVVYRPQRLELRLNWKIAIEIFLEAYHFRHAHRTSIYPLFIDNVGLIDRLAPHIRCVYPKRTLRDLAGTPEETWQLREHANILYFVFPNTLMLVQSDHINIITVFPLDIDRTDFHSVTLIPEAPTSEKALRHWDKNVDLVLNVMQEDSRLGESIQRGLRSGANASLRLARFEHGLRYFHEAVDQALGSRG